MTARLYVPSLATLFAFLALFISSLLLWKSMGENTGFQAAEPALPATIPAITAPIPMAEPIGTVDIYPLTTRPLFSPARRMPEILVPPTIEPNVPPPEINPTPQSEALPPPELVMIGILLDGPAPKALIRDVGGTEKWVKNGDTIEGWRVVHITTQSITLQLNAESVDIYSID